MRAVAPVKAFTLRRHLTQKLRRGEARAVFFRQTIAQGDESGGAHAVDVGNGAAGEGREAKSQH